MGRPKHILLSVAMRVFFVVALVAVILAPSEVDAQKFAQSSAEVHFKQSSWELDTALFGNGRNINRLIKDLEPEKEVLGITKVVVTGAASPEGSLSFNSELSHKRAQRIFDYINSQVSLPDSITSFRFLGRDWKGLRELVKADPNVPSRNQVLALLDEIVEVNARNNGELESLNFLGRLRKIGGGAPYKYMYERMFPSLRKSLLIVNYGYEHDVAEIPQVDLTLSAINTLAEVPPMLMPAISLMEVAPARRPFYMAVKTNMLYDAATVPNLGVEFYLGKDWTVGANGMYAWWSKNVRHRYWRIYGGEIYGRRWFGKAASLKPLTGHHVGLYAGVLTFDFEWGGKGYMGGKPGGTLLDRCLVNAGIEYGYSLPVARRLNIDFTLGLGYLGGKYIKYLPGENNTYVKQSTHHLNFFGPTKAEISLVWLIGHGNVNPQKGGVR